MKTKIHITKKLEKLIKNLISEEKIAEDGILGKWNATVFYVDRKKCWLITNGLTKYNVILTDIKASELSNIERIFKDALFGQLIYDGIILDFEVLDSIIGGLDFLPTDNDRSTTGFQNHNLKSLEWWKYEFGSLENMPIKDLTNRLNTTPIHIGNERKMSDYTNSIKEIKNILTE
ncbi:DUF6933 domain-containing protein [Psychroflexus planctonicus]|uniref:DUF6933 domain-containing protein n=1 Tax=Psychroflexus planctonicus TaxID=1526575 RepID=A0ABQ1SDU6_9FLAO|nr:hypothetical protein [Psychroflexus planctonicus]GGE28911.1 hypothetical protein GCM10010832_06940 [Psychroflexus planctonicus]